MVVDGAHTISFALGSAEMDARRAGDKLRGAADARKRRDALRETVDTEMEYMAYVSLLADPAARARLGVRLDPGAFPAQLPRNPTTGQPDPLFETANVKSVEAHRRAKAMAERYHLDSIGGFDNFLEKAQRRRAAGEKEFDKEEDGLLGGRASNDVLFGSDENPEVAVNVRFAFGTDRPWAVDLTVKFTPE